MKSHKDRKYCQIIIFGPCLCPGFALGAGGRKGPNVGTDGNDRVVCIDEMHFDENGHIKPVKITFEGVKKNKL